jgi:hypothetical protein
MTSSRPKVWTRLEPETQDSGMEDALRAPVRDPVWMLSRQWQVSEFEGEDAGSPVRADLSLAEDRLGRVDLRGGGRGARASNGGDNGGRWNLGRGESPDAGTGGSLPDGSAGAGPGGQQAGLVETLVGTLDRGGPGDPFDYEGEPLEATVERGRVLTGDDPPTRLRAETGQQFLRLLAESGYGEYAATDFPGQFRLNEPDELLEAPDRRYVDLMAGRALDGTAVVRAIQSAVSNITAVVADEDDSWSLTGSDLPLPSGGSRTGTYDECIEAFYAYYTDIYDEPTARSGTAWDPTRLEYRFAVSTGGAGTETVFQAPEYHGGHLDWYAFSAAENDSLDPPGDATTEWSKTAVPTQVSFPGMPAQRWWELEDKSVDFSKMVSEGAPLTRLMLTEFATVYGNDWFRIPVESPVGTLTRITDLTVTDSFGITDTATSATDDEWQLFMHDLPDHDEPGLFVPPTLGTSWQSDPVEEVTFARDELANLVFGLERRYESPTGRSVDRVEFTRPTVVVESVSENADPDEEYVELQNPGEDRLALDGYAVVVPDTQVHAFGEYTLGPGETVRVYTGDPPDSDDAVGGGNPDSVLQSADSLSVQDDDGTLVRRTLLTGPADALADYRLSTDVPDYWFPFTVKRESDYRLKQALLLDADSLGHDIDQLATPRGEILDPPAEHLPEGEDVYRLYDEEVTRSGRTVTRQYQFARWLDGSAYLWSNRESHTGDTQLDSGLRFDLLDERE